MQLSDETNTWIPCVFNAKCCIAQILPKFMSIISFEIYKIRIIMEIGIELFVSASGLELELKMTWD